MVISSAIWRARWVLVFGAAIAMVAMNIPTLGQEEEGKPQAGPKIYVHLETPGRLSYAGDPNRVTILLKNEGTENWNNPGLEIEAGFQVYDSSGKKLEKQSAPKSLKEGQPKILEPEAYFGSIIDLNSMFPAMTKVGSYRVTWSAPDLPEKTIVTRVIKKYDLARDYRATIDTEFGKIVIEFYKDLAPMHVKNFIDLANQGFYDGRLFHRTIKGEMVFAGSPTGDERGSPGYNLTPEMNGLKILPGSIAQVRNALTGAEESGSIFMIAATAQPDMDNRYTVFARVVEGLETVKAISNLPNAGGTTGMASRPIRDVVMKTVGINEKKASSRM